MTHQEFSAMALSFPGTISAPHFDRTAFKVLNKRIFATMHDVSSTVNVRLSPAEQKDFVEYKKKIVYPVPNKWGLQGWTTFELKNVPAELMQEALESAYNAVVKPNK